MCKYCERFLRHSNLPPEGALIPTGTLLITTHDLLKLGGHLEALSSPQNITDEALAQQPASLLSPEVLESQTRRPRQGFSDALIRVSQTPLGNSPGDAHGNKTSFSLPSRRYPLVSCQLIWGDLCLVYFPIFSFLPIDI